jgi:uncharacterized Zn finger protein (UPF0148 family)
MSSDVFKVKKTRDVHSKPRDTYGTLDSMHEQYIHELSEKSSKANVEGLSARIQRLQSQLNTSFDIFDFDESIKRSKLQAELNKCQAELSAVVDQQEVRNYYLSSGDIMLDYYAQPSKKSTIPLAPKISVGTFDKLFSVSESAVGPSKKKMFDEYMVRRGLSDGVSLIENPDQIKKMSEHCAPCNVPREEITSEGILVCPKCGSEEYALVVSDFPSFRDTPKERNNYAYKKQNHLNEILNQFQAKESTEIPEDVMNEVICELRKRRIDNIALLSEQNIREILKKLGRNRYYEHAAHILSRLNGNPPPTITPEIEDKIRAMFQEVQAPYLLYCPDERRNFLSYSYIIYKFLELLELDEYKVHFPLLKSRDRLIQHDQIWKKICDYLQWEFIQSV